MRLWLFFAAFASAAAVAQQDLNVTVSVGAQKIITVPGLSRVAVADAAVAEVKTLPGNQLLIVGSAEGKTSLQMWKTSGEQVSVLITVRRGQKLHAEETHR